VLISIFVTLFWSTFLLPERRRRRQFFGLGRGGGRIHVFTSFLRIQPGGAAGTEGLRKGFTGAALIRCEYLAARSLRLSLDGRRVSRPLLRVPNALYKPIDIVIDASPPSTLDETTQYGEPLIILGSRVYNRLAKKYFDDNPDCYFLWDKTEDDERTFSFRRDSSRKFPGRQQPKGGEDPTTFRADQLAIIERHYDEANERWVILTIGIGAVK
jgi:hypothetical protein